MSTFPLGSRPLSLQQETLQIQLGSKHTTPLKSPFFTELSQTRLLGFSQQSALTHQPQEIRSLMNPLPSQVRLLDEQYEHKYVLYGGAAGPGKSYGLRWAAVEFLVHWAAKGVREARVGLFCEDYPSLKDRHLIRMRREFPPELGELKETKDEGFGFYLRPEWGGGLVSLRNLDDPSKYASAEFAAIYVDELTKNPRQAFDDLRFRLRWPGIDHNPFVAGTNPGSIGHGWVKKLWVDRDFSGEDARLDPESLVFIPAKVGENPHVSASYLEMLDSLPERMRKAFRDGDWDVFVGQVFNEWDRQVHVCEPKLLPGDWTRWVAIDYGYSNPFCALWFAKSPKTCVCYGEKHDHIYVYRELYAPNLRTQEQATKIRFASRGERISMYPADPSMWQKREGVQGDSLAQEYQGSGISLIKANNDRMAGLNAVREALGVKKGMNGQIESVPRLRVFSNCVNLIRTLPALPHDPIRVEDVDTDAEDHAYDALRYGLMALDGLWETIPVLNVRSQGTRL